MPLITRNSRVLSSMAESEPLASTTGNTLSSDTYVASLSSRTIVYKGMFLVGQLRQFYLDLRDEDYTSAIALV